MRVFAVLGAAAATTLLAGAAQAQELKIRHAAARVVVIPENRGDVLVTIGRGAAQVPPLQVRRTEGGGVMIEGDLRRKIGSCSGGQRPFSAVSPDPNLTVEIRGMGKVRVADLPLITARVPMNAKVEAGGAVWGSVGRADNLDLGSAGCGDWVAANVNDKLSIALAGSGDVVAGTSRSADIAVAGSGDVRIGAVSGPLDASIAGSGDIYAAAVNGSLDASIAGSGDVVVAGGRLTSVDASILGSGDVRVDGTAESLDASIAGSGDVRVAQVLRGVDRSVMGSGDVIVAGQVVGRRRD